MVEMCNKDNLIDECLHIYKEINKHGFRFRAINRHLLSVVDLSGGKGLAETVEKIKEQLDEKDEGDISNIRDTLLEKYVDFLSYADKEVCILKLSPSEASSLVAWFENDIAEGNPFSESFPNLPQADKISYDDYYSAKIFKSDSKSTLYFGSKRRVRERVDLHENDLTQSTRHRLAGLEKIAAYTLNDLLSIDVLSVDTNDGTCEVRLTNASNNNMTNVSKDEAFSTIYKKVRSAIGTRRVIEEKNFYPCILPLYQDKHEEGTDRVTKFFFEADENGLKKETKPYDKADLRDEKYHGSGSQAINYDFRPYVIRKIWDIDGAAGGYQAGVEVAGSPRVLDSLSPKIDQVKILGCYGNSDYRFIMSKILPYAI